MENNLILMLHIVDKKGRVNELMRRGLTFSEISELIDKGVTRGLLIKQNSEVQLTELGMSEINKIRQSGNWIIPRNDLRIEKIAIDEIYLPSEEDSYFK